MEAKLFSGQQNINNCMESEFNERTLEEFLEQCVDQAFQLSPENGKFYIFRLITTES